ncbi:MAG: alpha-glucan family phosphorylase, partial [Deltaproteobacteria bacterium]|nr:alpha-glucan family phosphorylase [Deltaproteobacteria bacterium]
MRPLRTIFVEPRLPARIGSLWELAHNLRWSWDHVTWRLFAHIDPELWKACEGNPVRFLGALSSEQLEALAADDSFCHQLDAAAAALEAHLSEGSTWFRRHSGDRRGGGLLTAYFSAEFGLTDALQVFSGGLGILAGDHLKSSSDMGVPLVGVGLAYQHGYFRQYLSPDGWQQERYPSSDFHTMPVRQVLRADGSAPLEIEVPLGLRSLRVLVWEVLVGRNRLLLLDANHPANPPEDREITSHLYGGDQEMRIRQELVLGIGGVLVLEALGLRPRVFHINEGHAAFLAL